MGSFDTVLLVGLFVAALAAGQAAIWAGGARREAARRAAVFHWDGRPPMSPWPTLGSTLERVPGMRALQRLQAQAGNEVTGLALVSGSLLLAVGTEVAVLALGGDPVLGLLAAVPSSVVPIAWLYAARAVRAQQVLAELPAAMRSLYRLSGAGHGPAATVQEAARAVGGPLGIELRRAFEEQRRGRPLAEALRAMADRVPGCVDLRLLVTSIVLAEESGADLGAVLAKLESTLSQRLALDLKLRAETARARISAAIITGMPFVGLVAIYFIDSEWILAGWADPGGRLLQKTAAGLMVTGLLISIRLLRRPR